MSSSWKHVIFSWVNACEISAEHIETVEDLSDETLISGFLPSDTKDLDVRERLLRFLHKHYPDILKQFHSEVENEDIILVYSLLMHYYSYTDDPSMRMKMCSVSPALQWQIKRFLEYLLNKDITKDNVQMATKWCCERTSPVQSPIEIISTPKNPRKSGSKNLEFGNTMMRQMELAATQLSTEIEKERDARLYFEEQYEKMKNEMDEIEIKKNEEIKRLERKLRKTPISIDKASGKHTPRFAYNAVEGAKIMELKEIIKCLEEKCANLKNDNYRLSEEAKYLNNQIADCKLEEEESKTKYMEILQTIETKDKSLRKMRCLLEQLTDGKVMKQNGTPKSALKDQNDNNNNDVSQIGSTQQGL